MVFDYERAYGLLYLIRRTEEEIVKRYHRDSMMRCPTHLSIGQETSAVGGTMALDPGDRVWAYHRCHAHYLAKGGDLDAMIAELHGKATGCAGGWGGSMHLADSSVGFTEGSTSVGNGTSIAVGAAFASKLEGEGRVVATFFGDAAVETGQFWESVNFASLHQLPIMFVCENNLYSTYSRQTARQVDCDIAGRARAFGVPSRRLYGNDALGIFRSARQAIAKVRKGHGPQLLELETYRWLGHVGPEDDDYLNYRPMDELDKWKKLCPIEAIEKILLTNGIIDKEKIDSLEVQYADEISRAFKFAKSSPFPESSDLLTNVFSENPSETPIKLEELLEFPFDFGQTETAPLPY